MIREPGAATARPAWSCW